jgi:hypothetical protein
MCVSVGLDFSLIRTSLDFVPISFRSLSESAVQGQQLLMQTLEIMRILLQRYIDIV